MREDARKAVDAWLDEIENFATRRERFLAEAAAGKNTTKWLYAAATAALSSTGALMTKHQLKILPDYFTAIMAGTKTFEVRINDRDYKVGDILQLQEYHSGLTSQYTGRTTEVIVTYVMDGEDWGYSRGGL